MNKKGFTLVELLSVLVILGLIVGITIPTIISVMNHSKDKSEEAFVGTIKDAMNVYLSGNEKNKIPDDDWKTCSTSYDVAKISFRDVIDSTYQPINTASLVNPKNDTSCAGYIKQRLDGETDEQYKERISNDVVKIYRHKDNYVYYYVIARSIFVDMTDEDIIAADYSDKVYCLSDVDPSNPKDVITNFNLSAEHIDDLLLEDLLQC